MKQPVRFGDVLECKGTLQFVYEWHRSAEWNTTGFCNPYPTFWLMLSGTRIVQTPTESVLAKPLDLIVIPANQVFTTSYADQQQEPLHYLAISASITVHHRDWLELYGIPHMTRLSLESKGGESNVAELIGAWQRLVALREQQSLSTGESMGLHPTQLAHALELDAATKQWVAAFLVAAQPFMTTAEPVLDERVREACRFMASAYAEPLVMAELAQKAHLSEGHLRMLFRHQLGVSPYQYLLTLRLDKAKELMLNSELPLADIAATAGFGDYNHFQKRFRQSYKLSPSQYRHQMSQFTRG